MSDLAAGTVVQAFDYPATVEANYNTALGNITATSYTDETNLTATFIAPSTGRVMVMVSFEGRDNASTNFVRCSMTIDDDRDNSEAVGSDAYARGASTVTGSLDYESRSGIFLVEGLEPGNIYQATFTYRVSGGTSADLDTRQIAIWPAT